MNRTSRPVTSTGALIFLTAVTLALAGCGRKGGLDLPPTASAGPANARSVDPDAEREANRGTVFNPSFGADRPPEAAKGSKKSFILDPLLNN